MAKSLRLTDLQERVINALDDNFSDTVREYLNTLIIEESNGVCAHCGTVTFQNTATETDGTTPLGQALNLNRDYEILLCETCSNTTTTAFTTGDDLPDLTYMNQMDYTIYRLETDYIDQTSDEMKSRLLFNRDLPLSQYDDSEKDHFKKVIDCLLEWSETPEFEDIYSNPDGCRSSIVRRHPHAE